MGPFVEGLGDIAESLLASSIPDVQSDQTVVDLDPLHFKVDSNGA
jgi:hypothetical protein